MAQYFKFAFNGTEFTARCNFRSTRNGFAHDCEVWDENYNGITEATCHYLNRTWECYRFESVLHKAISQIAEEQAETIVEQWKEEHGKSRISKALREELTAPTWEAQNLAYDTIKAL